MLQKLSPYWLWLLISIPALGVLSQAIGTTDPRFYHMAVHPTGEWAIRMMLITMLASPLALVFRGTRFPRWLVKNRRYFGVAAFGYAALHTIFYVLDKNSAARIIEELPRTYIWTGWLAFVIFIPLAATSMDWAMRKMGTWWKWLQRWTYAAAILAFVHWAALHDWRSLPEAAIWFAPLVALSVYRLWYWYLRPRRPAAAA